MRPKRSMTSFDVRAEAADLAGIVGARFQKAYDPTPDSLLIRLHRSGGRVNLLGQMGRFIVDTGREVAVPATPGHFPSLLRKHLSNAPLVRVSQHDFDRVLVLSFGHERTTDLVIELFGRGNAVLVREGRIIGVHHAETWRDRTLKGGADYRFPASRSNPLEMDYGTFREVLMRGTDVVRSLALELNLGGTYAEEVCLRAGLDKESAPGDLPEGDVEAAYEALRGLLAGLEEPSPNIVGEGGEMVDAVPLELAIYEDLAIERVPRFNEALDRFFSPEVPVEVSAETIEHDHLERIL
ncbi:MAG TPA: fibronectin-binding domain-containing protein, partial [Thermoplasmata archaeon]|nr:fibronectin-binding domain-containing protein [Thermoplasmata archaeon]